MNQIKIVALSMTFALSGCVSMTDDPWLKDVLSYPERVELEDSDTPMKMSYLSRAMMESDNRAELEAEVANSELVHEWSAAQASILAQMSTDLVVGDLYSAQGNIVGTSVFAAGLVFGEIFDGSEEITSKAWLPAEYNGKQIETPEQAEQAIITLLHQQAELVADRLGWQMTCVHGCDSSNQVLYFENVDGKALPDAFIYQPNEFVLNVQFTPFKQVELQDPISAIIGQPIKWETRGYHSFYVGAWGGVFKTDDGSLDIRTNEHNYTYAAASKDLMQTRFGRDVMRIFHSTPYTLFGSADLHPKAVYYNGELYSFISNSRNHMVSYKIDEQNVL
ncbi:hypothetical protein C9I98_07085 [Photobacterium sanctipauli]|uniref:Uncharacterized protein n=1 Tax=Photobacterium sanctipauli TaxID=1342794 RepID=A0A2T3NWL8_9GAMM|nr:hypothetical protein [Photobacterium sanctipauli]PSW20609.1 hypothetical protein C9I98_07085 [Photobacterium sanctipauli]